MKSIKELNDLKEKTRAEISPDISKNTRIIVGMATCGLAAGSKPVYNELKKLVKQNNLTNVSVVQVGCIGMCRLEPLVEVLKPNQPKVTYVSVTPDIAKKIFSEHVLGGKVLEEYVIKD